MWNVDVDVCIHNCDEFGQTKNLDLNLQSMINNNQFQMSANNFHILTLSSNFHVVKKYIAVLSDTGASSISTPFKRKQRLLFLLSSNFSNIHCIRAYQNRSNFEHLSVWKLLFWIIQQEFWQLTIVLIRIDIFLQVNFTVKTATAVISHQTAANVEKRLSGWGQLNF